MEWYDDFLSKLEKTKELVAGFKDQAADAFRQAADLLRLGADALDKGADVIDPTPGTAGVLATDRRARLVAVRDELAALVEGPHAQAFPWELLIPILVELVNKLIDRRFPPPRP